MNGCGKYLEMKLAGLCDGRGWWLCCAVCGVIAVEGCGSHLSTWNGWVGITRWSWEQKRKNSWVGIPMMNLYHLTYFLNISSTFRLHPGSCFTSLCVCSSLAVVTLKTLDCKNHCMYWAFKSREMDLGGLELSHSSDFEDFPHITHYKACWLYLCSILSFWFLTVPAAPVILIVKAVHSLDSLLSPKKLGWLFYNINHII